VAQGSGLTRGDRNRNRQRGVLREVVRLDRVILAVDLGEDKQAAAVMDHDGRVLGRKVVVRKAHQLGGLLEWAAGVSGRRGFAGVTVACEPTGHRWKSLMGLADEAGHGFVCVQPLAVARARESDDYTLGKTDNRDTLLIGTLARELKCYLPEREDAGWARLRHLGARRAEAGCDLRACAQQALDLLGCCWPAALETARHPADSVAWLAAVSVVASGCGGRPETLRAAGYDRFLAAVREELPRWGGRRACGRIVRALWDALADPAGVAAQRPGGLERIAMIMADWQDLRRKLADTGQRMLAALDDLGLTGLAGSITGVSALAAAAMLAESGDPSRFASARALVKHAGLNPSEHSSATLTGKTRISRRGRPGLRTAAWRAVWAALNHNPVLQAKYQHLTSRGTNRLAPGQARAACAAAVLRWLYSVITTRRAWDPAVAAGAAAPAAPAAA
jgi:transposase